MTDKIADKVEPWNINDISTQTSKTQNLESKIDELTKKIEANYFLFWVTIFVFFFSDISLKF